MIKKIVLILFVAGLLGCANPIVDMVERDVMEARCASGDDAACVWLEENPE